MDSRASTTPPAIARPKNPPPPSTIAGSQAQASSSSQLPASMVPPRSRASPSHTTRPTRSSSKLVDAEKTAARPTSKDSLKNKMPKMPEEPPRSSKAEEVSLLQHAPDSLANAAQHLKAMKTDFDNMRSLVTCKICDRLLYQPYTVACGHTYCYTVRHYKSPPLCYPSTDT